jgi:hypothetical protein
VSAAQVARELNDTVLALGGAVYSDASEWDRDWIRTLYLATGIAREFQVLSIQEELDSEQLRRFAARRRHLEGSGSYRIHRAGEDVRLIREAYSWAVSSSGGQPRG